MRRYDPSLADLYLAPRLEIFTFSGHYLCHMISRVHAILEGSEHLSKREEQERQRAHEECEQPKRDSDGAKQRHGLQGQFAKGYILN